MLTRNVCARSASPYEAQELRRELPVGTTSQPSRSEVEDTLQQRAASDRATQHQNRLEKRHRKALGRLEGKRQVLVDTLRKPHDELVENLYQARKTRWSPEAMKEHAPITRGVIMSAGTLAYPITIWFAGLAALRYCFANNRLEKRLNRALFQPEVLRAKHERLTSEIGAEKERFARASVRH